MMSRGAICLGLCSVLVSGCKPHSDSASITQSVGQARTTFPNGSSCRSDGECVSGNCQSAICVYRDYLAEGRMPCRDPSDCAVYDACHRAACSARGRCEAPTIECEKGLVCVDEKTGACGHPPVVLTIAAHTPIAHRLGTQLEDQLELTARFKNVSTHTVDVSTDSRGKMHVNRLTRNGLPIPPSVGGCDDCLGDLSDDMQSALRSLKPGEQSGDVSVSLSLVDLSLHVPDGYALVRYSIREAGEYEVVFRYQFVGREDGFKHVYRGIVESNPVHFTVR